jgi:hypothetical protein
MIGEEACPYLVRGGYRTGFCERDHSRNKTERGEDLSITLSWLIRGSTCGQIRAKPQPSF